MVLKNDTREYNARTVYVKFQPASPNYTNHQDLARYIRALTACMYVICMHAPTHKFTQTRTNTIHIYTYIHTHIHPHTGTDAHACKSVHAGKIHAYGPSGQPPIPQRRARRTADHLTVITEFNAPRTSQCSSSHSPLHTSNVAMKPLCGAPWFCSVTPVCTHAHIYRYRYRYRYRYLDIGMNIYMHL